MSTPSKTLYLQPPREKRSTRRHSTASRIEIRGHWLIPRGDDVYELAPTSDGILYVYFDLQPLSRDRTEIIAVYADPGVEEYGRLLLAAIGESYTESAEAIADALNETFSEAAQPRETKEPESLGRSQYTIETGEKVVKRKTSKSKYSTQDKLDALNAWEAIDRTINPIRLEDFLDNWFGNESGILSVAVSTFHSWRKLRQVPEQE